MIPAQPIKIMHVITDLNMGGAEMVLYWLLAKQPPGEFASEVISLTGEGPIGERIANLGIPVRSLGIKPGTPHPRLVTDIMTLVGKQSPRLIQTWMYHADLAGGLAARFSGNRPVVWGLHHTVAERGALKPSTYAVAWLNARLSHFIPNRIVCCAEATRKTHLYLGYDSAKMTVIPNGIDISTFHPDDSARLAVRTELGIDDATPLIGLCARFDPQKDHENFLRAARLLLAERPDVHFALWGQGVDAHNAKLYEWVRANRLGNNIHLLGFRNDSPRLMAALDVCSLSSSSEAFPLAVGEAMACGVPCGVTDVGDAALIVGDSGKVVPPRDSAALAKAWVDLLALPESERLSHGVRARQRIIDHYSVDEMVSAYSQLYRDIIASNDLR
jgi:glycosyltransferase involved in cell wall biosynthesis